MTSATLTPSKPRSRKRCEAAARMRSRCCCTCSRLTFISVFLFGYLTNDDDRHYCIHDDCNESTLWKQAEEIESCSPSVPPCSSRALQAESVRATPTGLLIAAITSCSSLVTRPGCACWPPASSRRHP